MGHQGGLEEGREGRDGRPGHKRRRQGGREGHGRVDAEGAVGAEQRGRDRWPCPQRCCRWLCWWVLVRTEVLSERRKTGYDEREAIGSCRSWARDENVLPIEFYPLVQCSY